MLILYSFFRCGLYGSVRMLAKDSSNISHRGEFANLHAFNIGLLYIIDNAGRFSVFQIITAAV